MENSLISMNQHPKPLEKQEYPKPVLLDVAEMKGQIQEVSYGNTLKTKAARKGCLFCLQNFKIIWL